MDTTKIIASVIRVILSGVSRRVGRSIRDGFLGAGIVGVGNVLLAGTMPREVLETVAVPLGLNVEEHEFILRQFVLGTMGEAPWGAFIVVTLASLVIRSGLVGVMALRDKARGENHV